MQLNEVNRSAVVAWSPLHRIPNLLATGTVAGTLDVDFSSSAHLEIFKFDNTSQTMKLVGKTSTNDRFNKLLWGLSGVASGKFPNGILAGGLANGTINIWDPHKLMNSQENDSLIVSCEKHTGSVMGLDFNPFQHNLLASGGSDAQIFVWDLQNTENPTVYNPGGKNQNQESGITCVAWNRKVQHILASSNYSGVTVIWDLKAKKSVLQFSDPNKKLRCRSIAWNPEEATQIVTASEDDNYPVLEVWDLRNAFSPLKSLQGHTGGIWSISWCPTDNDLILSCGRDNRTICWNIKTAELLCEIETNSQAWNNDVQWSPRIPALFSTCSLEGKVKIFSLQDIRSSSGEDPLKIGQVASSAHAPKWLKRPVGASFGFGGKLVSFRSKSKRVTVTRVVTDSEFLTRGEKLQNAISNQSYKSYCEEKISKSRNEKEKEYWKLLHVMLEEKQRREILRYLGYDVDKITQELQQALPKKRSSEKTEEKQEEMEEKQEKQEAIEEKQEETEEKQEETEEKQEETEEKQKENEETEESKDVSGLFSEDQGESVFESIKQPPLPLIKENIVPPPQVKSPIQFIKGTDTDGQITRALLVGNFEIAVEYCINANRMADALILAAYGGQELWAKTQSIYFKQKESPFTEFVSSVVKDNLRDLVERVDLSQWKETLATLCTYAKSEEFSILCNILGDRLSNETKDIKNATLCYICSGDIEKTLKIWVSEEKNSPENLQSLIEKITIFKKAINYDGPVGELLANKYSEYASILASQGELEAASQLLSFLTSGLYENIDNPSFILLDRLYHAQTNPSIKQPPFPFEKKDIPAPKTQPDTTKTQRTTQPPQPTNFPPSNYPPTHQTGFPQPSPSFTQSFTPSTSQLSFPPTTSQLPFPPQPSQPSSFSSPQTPNFPPPQTSNFPPPQTSNFPPPQTSNFPPPQPSNFPPPSFTQGFPGNPPQNEPSTQPPLTSPFSSERTPISPILQGPTKSTITPPPPSVSSPMNPKPKSVEKESSNPTAPPSTPTPLDLPAKTQSPPPTETPEENLAVINSLQSLMDEGSKSTDQRKQKIAKDVVSRLNPLKRKLATPKGYSSDVIQKIGQLCQTLQTNNFETAQKIYTEITSAHWEELGSSHMIGLKRLIELYK